VKPSQAVICSKQAFVYTADHSTQDPQRDFAAGFVASTERTRSVQPHFLDDDSDGDDDGAWCRRQKRWYERLVLDIFMYRQERKKSPKSDKWVGRTTWRHNEITSSRVARSGDWSTNHIRNNIVTPATEPPSANMDDPAVSTVVPARKETPAPLCGG